jgi:hypothetical protein
MPGRVNFADLPRSVKSLVVGRPGPDRKEESEPRPGPAGPRTSPHADRRDPPRPCHICGQTFCYYAQAEAHADRTGHLRIEIL